MKFKFAPLIALCAALTSLTAYGAPPRIHPAPDEIVRIFSDPSKFKGTKGYLYVSDRYFHHRMDASYRLVREALGGDKFRNLDWRNLYSGTVRSFLADEKRLVASGDSIYRGREGYVRFADEFYGGNLRSAYRNMAAILDLSAQDQLGWFSIYNGSTKDWRRDREFLIELFDDSKTGPEGYMKFADIYYGGSMPKAFNNASGALTPREFENLGWGKLYSGTTKDYRVERERLASSGDRYRGRAGYIRYANEFHDGNMDKAYKNAAAVQTAAQRESRNWEIKFVGRTDEFEVERARLLFASEPFYGQEGYLRYAILYTGGSMSKAFNRYSAVLTDDEKARLNWGANYKGHADDFGGERLRLLAVDQTGGFRYWGRAGYIQYAADFSEGSLERAFDNMSTVLSAEEKARLDWGLKFHGSIFELNRVRNFLADENGKISFHRWFGKADGLTKATDAYLLANGHELPLNEAVRLSTRYQLRAAVTADETLKLGWNSVRSRACAVYVDPSPKPQD